MYGSLRLNTSTSTHNVNVWSSSSPSHRPHHIDFRPTMSTLKRVNRRPGPSAAAYYNTPPAASPSPVLYPPSGGPSSGRGTPASSLLRPTVGPGSGRSSPPLRPDSSASQRSQYSESPFGGGMSSNQAFPRSGHDLETHNDDLLSGLMGKVDVLKSLTIGIGDEVRAGNAELAGMTDDFGSTSNVLSGTWKRMTRMAKRQSTGWCYFMGFMLLVLWIFIIVWWLRR
ncbi:uncharacterized protein EHS24_003833 [Apiotrichum porosum]|uniref:t-SNARE coiled-coil homology domain-containing protein n=1 Tax=Apiotrichum porosum TaxID=105984 RepID=A0A427XDJ2_9TREE|nr:uncharacterized protein EHS24_003833 [Apiotrichum porosum]RSH76898.1 hypothetical protein EHS24_003833 [Apiotrichum porosum]